jgi:transcriptional regulator with XRE-family HTH domain
MDDQLQPRLGELLRQARQRHGLTQAQVARAAGLVPAVYGRLERGTGLPSLGKLKALCDKLGTSADTLLCLRQPAPTPSLPLEGPTELRRIVLNLRSAPPEALRALDRLVRVLAPPARGR